MFLDFRFFTPVIFVFNTQTFLYITGEIIIIVSYFHKVWNKLLAVFHLRNFQRD